MTDKEQIKCKYKFQDKEKFSGKPYCICFSELCEDLSFVCDHNCQIYEDFKQLARKEQEYNDLLEQHKELDDRVNRMIEEKYNLENECEWLKYLADANPNSTLRLRNKIRDLQAVSVKYKEALEEIEFICHQLLDNEFIRSEAESILDIINKVKGIGKNI